MRFFRSFISLKGSVVVKYVKKICYDMENFKTAHTKSYCKICKNGVSRTDLRRGSLKTHIVAKGLIKIFMLISK